jgi:tetratricopeptide (TPR) repeat protein
LHRGSPGDSVEASLEIIEGGVRSVRAGIVSSPATVPDAVQLLGRNVAERLRPMLGSRWRERQLEAGTSSQLALQHRRRADQYRLMARERAGQGDAGGAAEALDSAETLLLESQRLDPKWMAPRLARASLVSLRVIPFTRSGDTAAIRRTFDASIALVDSVLSRNPRDAAALAQRGRLRWRKMNYPGGRWDSATVDSARRDLEAALAADSTLARAAADLSQLLFDTQLSFAGAAAAAERAYRVDAFLEDASFIINRLAQSRLELGMEAEAWKWCTEGVRRDPNNPAHYGCFLEVMAWGSGVANPDSAWKYYRELGAPYRHAERRRESHVRCDTCWSTRARAACAA